MSFKQRLRGFVGVFAAAVVFLAWAGVAAVWAADMPTAIFTAAVVVAAFATEGAIWVAAVVLGWSLFENRRALWRRLTGGKQGEA
ncbi:hypothetical protein DDZ18_04500 [Marinicauda salina]|uniref:Uncharacterized protein n=1 Tax=Marinicauda salina TaxID=2135793 RepID=A0A2U2BXW5_9PROT|nr:hypothetical protein [Marinicauda salina]PWE18855.1 hypothetical protein DDZ18_04500 [Marinicauda salina]